MASETIVIQRRKYVDGKSNTYESCWLCYEFNNRKRQRHNIIFHEFLLLASLLFAFIINSSDMCQWLGKGRKKRRTEKKAEGKKRQQQEKVLSFSDAC